MALRIFPRHTAYTPIDSLAFVGDPPLTRPPGEIVLVSVTFTWDIPEGKRLAEAWGQYYAKVELGGPAFGDAGNGFTAGCFVKPGITFTSRGCNNACPWCLVPEREGPLRELDNIEPGYIIQDNNFLQCSEPHRQRVYSMLRRQRKAAMFAGGLDARLLTENIAEELRGIRINCVFLAADTDDLAPLRRAIYRLSFLRRRQLRCYVLCGFDGQKIEDAEARLERVWELGAMPFAQLYRPPDQEIAYSREWRALARKWSRPAAMMATHDMPILNANEPDDGPRQLVMVAE